MTPGVQVVDRQPKFVGKFNMDISKVKNQDILFTGRCNTWVSSISTSISRKFVITQTNYRKYIVALLVWQTAATLFLVMKLHWNSLLSKYVNIETQMTVIYLTHCNWWKEFSPQTSQLQSHPREGIIRSSGPPSLATDKIIRRRRRKSKMKRKGSTISAFSQLYLRVNMPDLEFLKPN